VNRRIIAVHVKEGDNVRKGQLLAELDVENLTLQRQKLVLAGEQIAVDLKELAAPTLTSAKTAILSKVAQLNIDLSTARRKLQEAEAHLKGDQSLFDSGALSSKELDASRALRNDLADQVKRTESTLASAKSEVGDLPDQTARQIDNLTRQQEQNLLDVALVDLQLSDSRIVASLDGLLTDFPLVPGRYPEPGATVRIQDANRYRVVIRLPQEDALQADIGQKAAVSLKGISIVLPATVAVMGKEAQVEGGSGSKTPKVKVTLLLDKTEVRLASGYLADVTIETGRAAQSASVRREAVSVDASGAPVIYVVDNLTPSGTGGAMQGTVRIVPVVPGLADDMRIALPEGPSVGTAIILAPSATLVEGTLVKGVEAP
jgi:multidrug resistance efflux pump